MENQKGNKTSDVISQEEIVEVEPEIVYFTEAVEYDPNAEDDVGEDRDEVFENAVAVQTSEDMPILPFDLSSSYIYYIEDSDCLFYENAEDSTLTNIEISEEITQEDEETDGDCKKIGKTPNCEICEQNFRNARDLRKHYENFHVKMKRSSYSCHICNKTFSSHAQLTQHDQFPCVDKKKIHCKMCGEYFPSTYLFSHHFKIEHEKKLQCVICQKEHTSENALMQHLQIHKQKRFSCDKCSLKCESVYELITHNKTHTQTLLYACNKCDEAFSTVPELASHIRTHGSIRI